MNKEQLINSTLALCGLIIGFIVLGPIFTNLFGTTTPQEQCQLTQTIKMEQILQESTIEIQCGQNTIVINNYNIEQQ
jgi:hypothetical protein